MGKQVINIVIYSLVGVLGAVRTLCRFLPKSFIAALGRSAGELSLFFFPREKKICAGQLQYVFPHSAELVQDNFTGLTRKVFGHIGESVAELLIIDRMFEAEPGQLTPPSGAIPSQPPAFKHFTSSGEEIIYGILRNAKGAVALSGHIGCIELLAAYHVRCGVPVLVIGRLPNYPVLARWLERLRTHYGVETLWRDEAGSAKKIIHALRDGKVIAALVDQDTALENCFAPFFGLDAASPVALIRLAVRYRIPIFSTFIARTARLQHHIETQNLDYEPDSPDVERQILTELNRRLERSILHHPAQWPWWHRRWRRRPGVDYQANPELLPSTNDYLSWLGKQQRPKAV